LANVTNTGEQFLNGLAFTWRVVDGSGAELDGGVVTWPTLAPGETATTPLTGSAQYVDTWIRVEFSYPP
jgi:hypothetical protein